MNNTDRPYWDCIRDSSAEVLDSVPCAADHSDPLASVDHSVAEVLAADVRTSRQAVDTRSHHIVGRMVAVGGHRGRFLVDSRDLGMGSIVPEGAADTVNSIRSGRVRKGDALVARKCWVPEAGSGTVGADVAPDLNLRRNKNSVKNPPRKIVESPPSLTCYDDIVLGVTITR